MNETIKTLIERRSIRKYKSEQITEDELNIILEAGSYAPSSSGVQSTIVVAIQDKELIKKLSKMNGEVRGTENDQFYGASTVIIVFGDSSRPAYIENGSLIMGNLMNAASSIGVNSCWIARAKQSFETEEGKALMQEWGIGGNYVGVANCILGYYDGEYPQAAPRSKENIIIIK